MKNIPTLQIANFKQVEFVQTGTFTYKVVIFDFDIYKWNLELTLTPTYQITQKSEIPEWLTQPNALNEIDRHIKQHTSNLIPTELPLNFIFPKSRQLK